MTAPTLGQRLILHACEECGRVEGTNAQAGCCPGCGIASRPLPLVVEVVVAPPDPDLFTDDDAYRLPPTVDVPVPEGWM